MFKKRSRPAAVRERSTPDVIDEPSPVSSEPVTREDTPEGQSIEQMLLVRKLRRGQQGIDLEKFNRGEEKKKPKATPTDLDKFGLQHTSGGGPGAAAAAAAAGTEDEKEQLARKVRSNNFTQQTNALDVNKHMMAYIEGEMSKRKGITEEEKEQERDSQAELYGLAERYKLPGVRVGEDQEGNVTTSFGMLSAIPEVDLGMDNRLRNIEETEKAKRELLERRAEAKNRARDDDPLASMRFYRGPPREQDIEREMARARREAAGIEPRKERDRERHSRPEMATDDIVMERFKKRMRR